MIGLDTNVLIRYWTQDDAEQSARANQLMESELSSRTPGFVSLVVVAEAAWVLRQVYGLDATALARTNESLALMEHIEVQSAQSVYAAARRSRDGEIDFHDALIQKLAAEAGCMRTVTFDRRFARLAQVD